MQAMSKRNTSLSHQQVTYQTNNRRIEISDNDKDGLGEKVEVSGGEEEDDGACDLGRPEILNLGVERSYMLIEDDNWGVLSYYMTL